MKNKEKRSTERNKKNVLCNFVYDKFATMTPIYENLLKQIQTGDLEEAQKIISQLLIKQPNDAWLIYLQGNAYRKSGNYVEAYNCYLKASELSVDTPAAEAAFILNEIYNFRNKDLYNQ